MKTILIAIDYGSTAQKVVEAGMELVKALNAKAILLHVVNDPAYYATAIYDPMMGFTGFSDINMAGENAINEIKKTAYQFLEQTKKHLGYQNVQTIIAEGNVSEAIISTAKSTLADIIVIGSYSQKWIAKLFLGSIAHSVLDSTTLPIYIVPTKTIAENELAKTG